MAHTGKNTYLGDQGRTIVSDLFRGLALEGATDKKSISRRETLYQKKRKLFNNALRDWQKRQTNKTSDRP
jgi:hypothetical protein